jgi:hypothetical protein
MFKFNRRNFAGFIVCLLAEYLTCNLSAAAQLGNMDLRGQLAKNYSLGGLGEQSIRLSLTSEVLPPPKARENAKPVYISVWQLLFKNTAFASVGRSGWRWQTLEGDAIEFSRKDAERADYRADGWRLKIEMPTGLTNLLF